jgi:hypothetical protein
MDTGARPAISIAEVRTRCKGTFLNYISENPIRHEQDNRTTGQQDNRTTGQQDNRTTGQQDNRTTKRFALLTALSGTCIMSSLIWTGCSKETTVTPTASVRVDVTPRVQHFVAEATGAQAQTKSDGFFSADSAIWYIEAGLNYSAAQAWRDHTDLAADSIVLALDLSSGSVSEAAVYAAYNTLMGQLAGVTTTEQHLYLVDLSQSGQAVSVYFQIASGYDKYNNAPNASYPAGYIAWWSNVESAVVCNTTNRAHSVIQQRINAANIIALQVGQFFHSVETWQVANLATNLSSRNYWWRDPFMASTTPNNNGYRESLLFSLRDGVTLGGGRCLNNGEMSYWTGNATTNGTWRGITKIRTTHCPTKLFSSCVLVGGIQTLLNEPGSPIYRYHGGQFTFGLIGGNKG